MASSRHVDAFVRRLEDGIAQEIHARSRVALAYSGGLASTLIAMIARKRCVLDCIVAGVDGSPDILAAKAAKAHLDYRVEYVILSREDAMRIRARIARSHRGAARARDPLAPVHAARARARAEPIVWGCSVSRPRGARRAARGRAPCVTPLRARPRG